MTENTSLPADPSDGSDTEDKLSGPGAGLSATSRGPGDVKPGEAMGSDYGDPGGLDVAVDHELSGDGQRDDDLSGEQ